MRRVGVALTGLLLVLLLIAAVLLALAPARLETPDSVADDNELARELTVTVASMMTASCASVTWPSRVVVSACPNTVGTPKHKQPRTTQEYRKCSRGHQKTTRGLYPASKLSRDTMTAHRSEVHVMPAARQPV